MTEAHQLILFGILFQIWGAVEGQSADRINKLTGVAMRTVGFIILLAGTFA